MRGRARSSPYKAYALFTWHTLVRRHAKGYNNNVRCRTFTGGRPEHYEAMGFPTKPERLAPSGRMSDLTGYRAPRVLIAGPAIVFRQLSAALPEDAEVIGATTWEDAVRLLSETVPHLIVVCYVFDE